MRLFAVLFLTGCSCGAGPTVPDAGPDAGLTKLDAGQKDAGLDAGQDAGRDGGPPLFCVQLEALERELGCPSQRCVEPCMNPNAAARCLMALPRAMSCAELELEWSLPFSACWLSQRPCS